MPRARALTTRRGFLAHSAAALAAAVAVPRWLRADERQPLRVAAIITEFTYRSHAHVILENFLKPYLFNGQRVDPHAVITGMYVDQFPADRDMARAVAKEFNIPIFPTIGEALTAGGDRLACDGVLSIGEHGNYPHNEKGQHEYPRKRFFDDIVATFRRVGQTAPVFNDKHLSFRWDWGREMYDTARAMGFPLMAGSSVPLAERRPPLEISTGTKITRAVSIHGGGLESYDFHGFEVLQSIVEARAGGETGIASVQLLTGDALWRAADAGAWSPTLAEAAMATELGPSSQPFKQIVAKAAGDENKIHGLLLKYRDGFEGTVLAVGGRNRWNFACEVDGGDPAPRATSFYVGPWENRNLFKALSHAIQTFFHQRRSPYPVERTLLATGVLDAAMQSHYEGGKTLDTPQLAISYQPVDFRAMREMGASWQIIKEGMPEPPGIVAVGLES